MDDQWVEFQKRSKIQEENASVSEQINQLGILYQALPEALKVKHCTGCLLPTGKA